MSESERLIVALDTPDAAAARALVDELAPAVSWFKVGMTLYFAEGPQIVRELVARDLRVFVDLKAHDIPHQVEGAVRALADLGCAMVTVHSSGGPAMLEAAARGAEGSELIVLAVTVLTSLDEAALAAIGVSGSPADVVLDRARLAAEAGLGGVVASPKEARALRQILPRPFEIVTPGIRPKSATADDQKRTSTPGQAIRAGASRLVVGRPITTACEPLMAARSILREIEAAR